MKYLFESKVEVELTLATNFFPEANTFEAKFYELDGVRAIGETKEEAIFNLERILDNEFLINLEGVGKTIIRGLVRGTEDTAISNE